MTVCTDLADYEWLTGEEACGLLNELAEHAAPLHTAVARLRDRLSPQRTHLLVEQLELRRRAAAKFTGAQQMFFTRIGLEQATDECVAAYKASRIQRAAGFTPAVFADLCCGIGGDLLALAGESTALGIDRDPIAAHFAAANTGAATRIGDVADVDLADFAAWHIDPARRPGTRHGSRGGRRTTSLAHCEPDLATIERLLAEVPHAAVKLAPATEVPATWAEHCELEWISRDRECRQQVAWHGHLAEFPGCRRATVLQDHSPPRSGEGPHKSPPRSGEGPGEGLIVLRTVLGQPNIAIPTTDRVDRYVFDIDPAILAAGLKGALAAEHHLHALDGGPTYLTGRRSIDDAALACFEVAEVLPLQVRKLAPLLRERSIGRLEIKKRGVDVDPEKLRRDLKLRGDAAATLLITRVAARQTAILARRYSPHPTSAKIDRLYLPRRHDEHDDSK